jgi:hypothetical protein
MPWPIRISMLAVLAVLATQRSALALTDGDCLASRYLVNGDALVVGDTAPHEPVTISRGFVSIGNACAPTPARYRFLRSGILVQAVWKSCTGLRGTVKFSATIAPGCATVTGRVKARKSHMNKQFDAVLSVCGDGIVDQDAGEQCDGGGCDAGDTCTACQCVPLPTTSTTSTTSTTTTTTESTTTTTLEPPGPSVARQWDEAMIDAIRRDTPRPTVHARNLYHVSAAMWDAWAVYDQTGVAAQVITTEPNHISTSPDADRDEAISFAAYRVLKLRYSSAYAVGFADSGTEFDNLMDTLGYDKTNVSTDGDTPAAVGNRIAAAIIAFGGQDGANEPSYGDQSYFAVNDPLVVKLPGTTMVQPNRWQPLALDFTVTQNGIPIPDKVQTFIGARWDGVRPFALVRETPGRPYHDPGPPAMLGAGSPTDAAFKATFLEDIVKSSMLDPNDGEVIDISPAVRGNNTLGTNDGTGYAVNPATGQPYASNVVKRGDWSRVLAEFWADGPNSETPPGHWNVIANYVTDHLNGARQIGGTGPVLPKLEWDVKVYLAVNGAVHDAAVSCWGAKRFYDGVRPISAIRYMGGLGQSSDPTGPSYDPEGLPLVPDLVEVITSATTAPGGKHEALKGFEGLIALRNFSGPTANPLTDVAGVKWILAAKWMPYQKATFVTPAFPGYFSGHSTFSRSAAEVLTALTNTPYFPGGLGEFVATQNNFLKTELGPSQTVVLQWATYYDAADEAGISRIFGGIHPPEDDFAGRITGSRIGKDAFAKAMQYFTGTIPH